MTAMLVVVIGGPIASGKSSLGRATAARLEELAGAEVGVIDLDLIYEMLDARGGSGRAKNDEQLWSQSRRVAGRLSAILLAEGRHVVAEGNFAEDQALAEFERALPGAVRLQLVMLDIDFEIALQRTQADASRGLSKDPVFLSAHYGLFSPQWREREVLQLNTGTLSLADATEAVTAWLTQAG
jgi:shikimate kinase